MDFPVSCLGGMVTTGVEAGRGIRMGEGGEAGRTSSLQKVPFPAMLFYASETNNNNNVNSNTISKLNKCEMPSLPDA